MRHVIVQMFDVQHFCKAGDSNDFSGILDGYIEVIERPDVVLLFLLRNREAPGSNLFLETGFPNFAVRRPSSQNDIS
jgi:hypothetical protein